MTERGRCILYLISILATAFSIYIGLSESSKKRKDVDKLKFILLATTNIMQFVFLSNI